MRPFAALTAAFVLAAAATAAEATENRTHLPLPTRPCAVCHGNEGISVLPGIPNLAGQKAYYLIKQVSQMRTSARAMLGLDAGKFSVAPDRHNFLSTEHRDNRDMNRQVAALDDVAIRSIADHFAAQPRACPPPGAERGARPAIAARCAVCHGEDGIGSTSHMPNLAGQHRLYLSDQIRKMRSAELGEVFIDAEVARASGIMGPQAIQVPEDQIDALARWFANSPCAAIK